MQEEKSHRKKIMFLIVYIISLAFPQNNFPEVLLFFTIKYTKAKFKYKVFHQGPKYIN